MEIKLKNSKSFLFCSVYRPPSSKSEWIDTFSLQIEKSLLLNNKIHIAGDLNIDFKDGNAANNKWKHMIETHDLSQHINTPTRVTAHSETIIDHVYPSDSAHMTDISIPNIALATITRSHLPVLQPTFTLNVRSIFPFSIALSTSSMMMMAFLMTSEQMNTLVISQIDINANVSNWTSKFMAVFDKHAPIRQKRVKRETQPEWVNDEIKTAMEQRNKYHGLKDWRQYKYWRNRITALIRKSKKNFFSRSINEHRDNTFLWRHVKSLSGQNGDRKDDVSYQTEKDVIEQLNFCFQQLVTD